MTAIALCPRCLTRMAETLAAGVFLCESCAKRYQLRPDDGTDEGGRWVEVEILPDGVVVRAKGSF